MSPLLVSKTFLLRILENQTKKLFSVHHRTYQPHHFPIILLKFMICLIPFKTLPQYIIQYRGFFCLNIKQCKTYRKENSYHFFLRKTKYTTPYPITRAKKNKNINKTPESKIIKVLQLLKLNF